MFRAGKAFFEFVLSAWMSLLAVAAGVFVMALPWMEHVEASFNAPLWLISVVGAVMASMGLAFLLGDHFPRGRRMMLACALGGTASILLYYTIWGDASSFNDELFSFLSPAANVLVLRIFLGLFAGLIAAGALFTARKGFTMQVEEPDLYEEEDVVT